MRFKGTLIKFKLGATTEQPWSNQLQRLQVQGKTNRKRIERM